MMIFQKKNNKDYRGKLQAFPYNNPALIFLYRCLTELLKNDDSTLFMVMPSSSFLYMPSSAEYRKSLVYFWNIERIYDFYSINQSFMGQKEGGDYSSQNIK